MHESLLYIYSILIVIYCIVCAFGWFSMICIVIDSAYTSTYEIKSSSKHKLDLFKIFHETMI